MNKLYFFNLQAVPKNDVNLPGVIHPLLFDQHIEYIANHGNDQNNYEYAMTEFLRMSGIYWGVTALDLMGQLPRLEKSSIIDFIQKCQCPITGGISACEGHDPHILYTLSAIQILCIYDALDQIKTEDVTKYVVSLQQLDGSFFGDKWGEVDTRFSFCAVAILSIIVIIFLFVSFVFAFALMKK